MVEVFDRHTRTKLARLEKAKNVKEDRTINSVWYLDFTLPYGDPKEQFCQPFNYVRHNNGQLFRIMPTEKVINEEGRINYKCEHVLTLLIDGVLFGQHVIGNIGVFTRTVIEWILDKQNKRFDPWTRVWTTDPAKPVHWRLGRCDFARQFEYGWEQETLLSALFSVPNFFTEDYIWTFDTHSYPFIINLERLDSNRNPQVYARFRSNMLELVHKEDPTTVCTRIYPLGEGEGVNQLNIRAVNNNVPFLQSPQRFIDRFGIVERIWIDRRYTNPESLRDAGAAMLHEMQEPFEEYKVDMAQVGRQKPPEIGDRIEVVDEHGIAVKQTFVTKLKLNHEELPDSLVHIANKPKDIAGTVANMMDRQRIEMAYAQGATTFFERDASGNCDPGIPITMRFMIPRDLRIINFVILDVEMGAFRKPFRVTGGGGGRIIDQISTNSSGASSHTTTQGGGSSTQTSTSGGASTQTSAASGSFSVSSAAGGSTTQSATHNEAGAAWVDGWAMNMAINRATFDLNPGTTVPPHRHLLAAHRHPHSHSVTIPNHTHNVSVGNHSHSVSVPAHSHSVSIPSHTHNMPHTHDINHTHTIPDHTHTLTPGVQFAGNPTSFTILIDGVVRQTVNARTFNGDISRFLVDARNLIPRGRHYRLEIRPNDAAHILMTVSIQGFVGSRGDRTM